MKPDLYICHTSWQLLIALVRALRVGGDQSLLLTKSIPGGMPLWQRVQETGAFAELAVVDEKKWQGTVSGPFAHLRNKRNFENHCGWYIKPGIYRNVYISNDWSVIGRYLQDSCTRYILCEDTIGGTLDADQHLLIEQRAKPAGMYRYWGDSKWCTAVESEDASKCTLFPQEKLLTFSKQQLLASLTSEEKAAIRHVFITQPLPENVENACLLLPRSFVLDGLMDQETQNRMFRAVAEKHCFAPLFIKTHPRDETDYQALFPEATVLDRTMPSEVLNFCLPFRFARAVAVQSYVLRGFTAAEESVFIGLADALSLIN